LNHSLRAGPVRRWAREIDTRPSNSSLAFCSVASPAPQNLSTSNFPGCFAGVRERSARIFRSLSDLPRCYARRSAQSFERIIAAVLETRVWNSCCLSPGSSGFSVDTNPARIRPMSLRRRTLFLSESRFERIAQETQAGLESVLSQAINE
jgi:hypothetical protein